VGHTVLDKQQSATRETPTRDAHPQAVPANRPPMPVTALVVAGLGHGASVLRPALTVGRSEDPAERAADQLADEVVAARHGGARVGQKGAGTHTAVAPEVGSAGGGLSVGLQSAIVSARGTGTALPSPIRREMESALSADLSTVRVHSGPDVARVADGISAHAFTVGSDVYLPEGIPDQSEPAGTHLLVHELAHVVQHAGPARRSVIRRDEKSAAALKELAAPQVFPGPDVKLQDAIVRKLEAKTPKLVKKAAKRKAADQAALDKWRLKAEAGAKTEEDRRAVGAELTRRTQALATKYPKFDSQELYLGSIVLTEIPPSAEGDQKMISKARLSRTENAFKPGQDGTQLSEEAGVQHDIVENTLLTMIRAGQIDYLRKAGFVGKGWNVIIEVHYIRNRPASAANLHKDTLGQTLFVNLNYTNKAPMAGPEYVENPPLVSTHEDLLATTMPPAFMADLNDVRARSKLPTEIKSAGTLDPNSVIAFVDEAIHHSTPLAGHRKILPSKLAEYLKRELPFSADYEAAKAAFDGSRKQNPKATGSSDAKPTSVASFVDLFTAPLSREIKELWESLLTLCEATSDVPITRPKLMELGMPPDMIDHLMSTWGPDSFNSVSIPAAARTNSDATGRIPLADEKTGQRPVLTRQISSQALAKPGSLAPVTAGTETGEGPTRTFFRTWVRAVKVGPDLL
jgi:hypothetical protein